MDEQEKEKDAGSIAVTSINLEVEASWYMVLQIPIDGLSCIVPASYHSLMKQCMSVHV